MISQLLVVPFIMAYLLMRIECLPQAPSESWHCSALLVTGTEQVNQELFLWGQSLFRGLLCF